MAVDVSSLLKTIAPWIGTALGGPLGGMALTAAAGALGISQPTTAKLQQALSGMSAADSLALQQADQKFQSDMAALNFKDIETLEALNVDDRKDARAMQVATKSVIPAILATVTTAGFLALLVGMMSGYLKVNDSQALLIMLGAMQTGFTMVLSYYFGSSAGSARKDELAAGATPRA